jgi:DNA-binding transcriptional ArsR family regulator
MADQPGDTGRPGTPQNPLPLTDPRMMRALAHPARIAIMEQLVLEGPATATECAEIAGLSPSACSYHLRTLARYGLVEEDQEAAADARHRPWRARVIGFQLSAAERGAAQAARRLLRDAALARFEEARESYHERESTYPAEWQEAGGFVHDVLHVTAGELSALRAEVMALFDRYRRLDAADRPVGARRVRVLLDLVPWFDPETGRGGPAGTDRPGDATGTAGQDGPANVSRPADAP